MLRDRLALTEEGARSLRKGALVCALANLVLMFPVGVFYLVTGEFLAHWEDGAVPLPTLGSYLVLIAVVLAAVFATQYWEYHATYSVVYQESAHKRIGLAERLRVLPLSFFGKRDLADLTTVIMKDAADQERLFSHTMPQAFGTGISTVIVAVMLLIFDWRLACASLWPVPVALLILLTTSRAQTAKTRGKNAAALALADDIQEYLESNREVRALNRTDDFLGRLNDDVDAFERAKLASELVTGTAVVCTQTLLRLGIVSTILVGTALVAAGQCSLLVFFCFMLVVTRLYDPIGLILQSVAELIDMTRRTIEGQALDIGWARDGRYDITPEDYLTMAIHKTAHYSGAVPLAVGAIVGGADDEIVEALRSYGLDTGLAFQIQDDLLNLVGTDEAKKKDFRSDITEGKRTLVVVHALQNAAPEARERLVEILSSKERDPEVLAEAVAIMEETGSIDYARTFAEDLTLNAKARLAGALPPSQYRDLLVSMADWFVNRLK